MAHTIYKEQIYTCDRCGHKVNLPLKEGEAHRIPSEWQYVRLTRNGIRKYEADLCSVCTDNLTLFLDRKNL